MSSHHSFERHVQASRIIVALFVFALLSAKSHGAFVSSPLMGTTTTIKSTRLSPTLVVQATESETKDKETSNEPKSLVAVTENKSFVDGIQQGLQTSLRIIRESQAQGYGVTQIMANVLAGDYDELAIRDKIDN
jgi:hypothetical protein